MFYTFKLLSQLKIGKRTTDNFHLRPKNSVKKFFFFKEFLEKSISKNTAAVVFYVAYTNITKIYGVAK